MKKIMVVVAVISLTAGTVWSQKKSKPKTQKEKISYSMGVSVIKNLKMQGLEIEDQNQFIQGIKDELSGGKTLLTEKEMEEALMKLQHDYAEKMEAKRKIEGEKNKKEGEAFLNENKKKAGVVTLPSGLQYKVITNGTGPKPTATQTVECHYRGTLINGKEFDNSYKRGQPAEFQLNKVIKGWTEALQLMPVGSKWQLFIPSELAYGENGAGAMIGPNSTLIFEVELIAIK